MLSVVINLIFYFQLLLLQDIFFRGARHTVEIFEILNYFIYIFICINYLLYYYRRDKLKIQTVVLAVSMIFTQKNILGDIQTYKCSIICIQILGKQ